jgi:acetyl-CoA acetyltransferase
VGVARSAAIAGLGMTEMGKVYGRSSTKLAAEAVKRAVADSGMSLSHIDGLLVSPGVTNDVGIALAAVLAWSSCRSSTRSRHLVRPRE